MPEPPTDEQLTTDQVAELLGVTRQTLWKYARNGIGPTYIQLGERTRRYPKSDLLAWIQTRRVEPIEQ